MNALLLLSLSACSTAEPPEPTADAAVSPGASRDIDTAALAAALSAGAVVLDVRTTGEFAGGHIAGAVNVPVGALSERVDELEAWRGQEIAIICQSGGRSAQAAAMLEGSGFTVANVLGGMGAWWSEGRPVAP
ncbi:MAG: rhodanese-like domain-containing protein [Myxococcota bacterium]|nr:rhodanese-like domain-containing protein [Myxococcota bacterium]